MRGQIPVSERVLRLLQIFREKFDFENKVLDMDEDETNEFGSLYESIVEDLMWSPGTLIYIADESERRAAQTLIDMIWKTQDTDEIFEEMTSGGYAGLLVNIVGDYIERAKMLRPTLISIDPHDIEFTRYFEEAMKAWLYGLNTSSLILCCSVVEEMIRTQLYSIDPNLALDLEKRGRNVTGVRNKKLKTLIDTAYSHNIIDNGEKAIAHSIRKLRNSAVHNLRKVSDKETYQAILDTKKLVEKILTRTNVF